MMNRKPGANLNSEIITNYVEFSEEGRIFILTGPNRGGKTTYLQAIGITQLLFQLGLFIPGSKALISPVDRIYTHFPVEEKPDSNLGRLGEESKRLSEILKQATRYSLVVLNESFCSTSFGEGIYISREVIAALKILGVRAVFATHFHDLAKNLDMINQNIPGDSKIISMISGTAKKEFGEDQSNNYELTKRTYEIKPGPPQGLSYAKDIASHFGISFENIISMFQSRDIIPNDFDTDEYVKQINV